MSKPNAQRGQMASISSGQYSKSKKEAADRR